MKLSKKEVMKILDGVMKCHDAGVANCSECNEYKQALCQLYCNSMKMLELFQKGRKER